MNLNSIQIQSGVNLHYIKTNKFKTTTFGVYIHRPLSRDEVTKNALLAKVLQRGCPLYPTSRELSAAMDNLFGAVFETNVRKKGDSQILSVNFSFANEKYLKTDEPILQNILKIAESLIMHQTAFNEDYVKQEKENLKNDILAEINDKRSYAIKRCISEMCKDEPFGMNRLGYTEDIAAITAEDLYTHYKQAILKSPVDIFVCGDVDIFWVQQRVKSMFKEIEIPDSTYPKNTVVKEVQEVKHITDTEQIVQGKLSLGFRTKIEAADPRYPALMLYNAILGSGVFSKLFNNVREKLSLAYYASSSVDYLKGIMTINSGIEVANFQKAYDEILVQMNEMKNGNITPEEYAAAKLGTVNSLKSLTDNAFQIEDYYLTKLITGHIIEIDELTKLIEHVTVEQIVEVAQNIQLDTVYFLKGSEK